MEFTRKQKIIAISALVGIAFSTGRYTVPTKVKIETKTVEKIVYKEKEDTKSDLKKHVIIVTRKKPTGEIDTKTDITYDKKIDEKTDIAVANDKKTDTIKIIDKTSPVNLNALIGIDIHTGNPIYGGAVSKNILGPIQGGAFGLTNGTLGVSVGLSL